MKHPKQQKKKRPLKRGARESLRSSRPLNEGKLQELLGRAVGHQQNGELKEAAAIYDQVLLFHPEHIDSLHMLGIINYELGNPNEAVNLVDRALQLQPENPEIHNNLAIMFNGLSKFDKAIEHFNRALELHPSDPVTLNNKGNALRATNALPAAQDCFQQAVTLAPDYAQAHSNLGITLIELEQPEAAKAALKIALNLTPTDPAVWSNLSAALQDLGEFNDALASANKALTLDANHTSAINNRGNVLIKLNHFMEAEVEFRRAIQIQPNYADAYINLGLTQQMQNHPIDAIETLKQGLQIDYNNPNLHWNLALALLQTGNFEAGWREYEWRWSMPKFSVFTRQVAAPRWTGEILAGQTLYIHSEQGLGDTIHFARYVPIAANQAARVIFECPGPLVPLFASISQDWENITVVSQPPESCDAQVPLLSLPLIFGTNFENIPIEIPYIPRLFDRSRKYTRDTLTSTKINVGLVWAGNIKYQNDFHRSIPFDLIAKLLDVSGACFYSLQVERLDTAAKTIAEGTLIDIGTQFTDFYDTADAISQLDLVISVDTSVAHLAGALGTPVWVLLPQASDWRWLLNRSDSPWYPTMRLFRQSAPGDWKTVINDAAIALEEFVYNT